MIPGGSAHFNWMSADCPNLRVLGPTSALIVAAVANQQTVCVVPDTGAFIAQTGRGRPAGQRAALDPRVGCLFQPTAASKANELKLPLVFTFHTRYREYSHYISLSQELVKEAIDRWVGDYLQKCHHIVVPSDSIKQMLADTYGTNRQVTTIPTGIDLSPYRAANRQTVRQQRGWGQDKVLISIGRLAKEKNWKTLLTAAAQVLKKQCSKSKFKKTDLIS